MGSVDVGTVLADRYELREAAASGATATVWAAHDEFLRRRVAVKVLHDHLRDDAALAERFAEEALTAASISHPALVAVFDTITEPPAIVMEWVDGADLRRRLTQGPMTGAEVVDLATVLCGGLAALHERGLVHRDVKPANVLLGEGGVPKLTDFGIATANAGDRTATGIVLGTAKYLAPEQVRGTPLDGRTDVYALSCVLYEALAGRPPWERDGDLPTALARLESDAEPLGDLRPDVDPRLTDTIMKGLARDPEQRWQSARAMADALLATSAPAPPIATTRPTAPTTTAMPTPSLGPPPARPAPAPPGAKVRRRRRWWPRLAGLALVAGVAALGLTLILRDGATTPTRAPLPLFTALTFDPQGTGAAGENDGLVTRAIDGDPATGWPTERYEQRDLGTKSGVGLVVVLAEVADVGAVRVETDGAQNWAAEVHITEMSADDFDTAQTPADFGPVVGSGTELDATATLSAPGRGNVVLVWFTDLGDGPTPFRLVVAEVTVT